MSEIKIPDGGKVGDIVSVQHRLNRRESYYKIIGSKDGEAVLALMPRWQAEAELRDIQHKKRVNALCADAMKGNR
jgi:hypothetical protein